MADILIIDDDKDILRMLEFAFRRAGHRPITTTSGREGLEIIRANLPQLMIVDIMMPEMTGYDFTRQVRRETANADLPIIIYSARFQPVDRQAASEAGATDYVPKSTALPELMQKVEQLLGNLQAETQAAQGQIIAFFSLRGGVGVTTLAVNIGVILAMSHQKSVCLADLNPIAGHAGLMLGLRPQTHFFRVLTANHEASLEETVKQCLVAHQTGVHLLASPLMPSDEVKYHTVKDVTEALRAEFSISLIDLPHILGEAELELLADVSKLILILSPDLPALQSAVAALKYLAHHGLNLDNIVPVLNHNMSTAGLSLKGIQQTIRRPLAAEIPYEVDMMAAANAGQPLILHKPQSPTAAALVRLAAKLAA